MKPWIAELATFSDAAMLAHCLCTLRWRNPRLTPLRIGRSDASGNSGNGGLEVAVKDEKQTNTRCGCCGGVPSRSVRLNDVHSAYEATREY
jgi:hypothetical protein